MPSSAQHPIYSLLHCTHGIGHLEFGSDNHYTLTVHRSEKGRSNFLVIIDSFSNWLEVFDIKNNSAGSTVDTLQSQFSSYGYQKKLSLTVARSSQHHFSNLF